MANETLLSLPTELMHHIFNYCGSKTVFLSVRRVCKRLRAVTEIYDRVALNVKLRARTDSRLIRRLIQPSTIRSLTFRGISAEKIKCLFPSMKMHSLDSLSIAKSGWECQTSSTLLTLAILHLNPRRLFLESHKTQTSFSFSPIDCKLEYLQVNECDQLGYLSILRQLSSLQTFVIDKCKMNEYDESIPSLADLSFSSRLPWSIISGFSLHIQTVTTLAFESFSTDESLFELLADALKNQTVMLVLSSVYSDYSYVFI